MKLNHAQTTMFRASATGSHADGIRLITGGPSAATTHHVTDLQHDVATYTYLSLGNVTVHAATQVALNLRNVRMHTLHQLPLAHCQLTVKRHCEYLC